MSARGGGPVFRNGEAKKRLRTISLGAASAAVIVTLAFSPAPAGEQTGEQAAAERLYDDVSGQLVRDENFRRVKLTVLVRSLEGLVPEAQCSLLYDDKEYFLGPTDREGRITSHVWSRLQARYETEIFVVSKWGTLYLPLVITPEESVYAVEADYSEKKKTP